MDDGRAPADLGRSAMRGAGVTMASQLVRAGLQFATSVVLARLLAPEDFGLVAIPIAVVAFAELLRDFGVGYAVIQRPRIDQQLLNGLFWLMVLAGVTLSAAVVLAAPFVAAFFGRDEAETLLRFLAIVVLVNAVTGLPQALLIRNLRFGSIAFAETVSALVAAGTGIAWAVVSPDAYALVGQAIVLSLVRGLMIWPAARWRPSRPALGGDVAPVLRQGGSLLLFNMTNYLARNVDNFIIGRAFGAGALGLYTRAYQLLLLPLQQLNAPLQRVAVPVLSRITDDRERYQRYFCSSLSVVGYMSGFVFAVSGALAAPLIEVVYGDRWSGAAPLYEALSVAGIAQAYGYCATWLYTSTGRTGRQAVWGLASRPVVIASFFVGLPFGVRGIAYAYSGVTLLMLFPALWWAASGSPVAFSQILRTITRSLLVTAVAAVVARLALLAMPGVHPAQQVVLPALAAAVAVAVTVGAVPGLRRDAVQMLPIARLLFRRSAATTGDSTDGAGGAAP